MLYKVCAVMLMLLLAGCMAASAADVYDTFESARTGLGTTEDAGHHPWLETYGNTFIWGDETNHFMSMWNSGNGTVNDYQATVGGFAAADVDISVDMNQVYSGCWHSGITYRQSGTDGVGDGYYAALASTDGVHVNYAVLWSADYTKIGEGYFSGPLFNVFQTLRVKAVGNHHQVYVADSLVIDAYDSSKLTAGYIGLHKTYQVAYWDNFSATVVPEPSALAGLASGFIGMLGFAIRRRRA